MQAIKSVVLANYELELQKLVINNNSSLTISNSQYFNAGNKFNDFFGPKTVYD